MAPRFVWHNFWNPKKFIQIGWSLLRWTLYVIERLYSGAMNFTACATQGPRRIFHQLRHFKLMSPQAFHIACRCRPTAKRFSRCHVTVASSHFPQYSKTPALTRYNCSRSIRTSSMARTCSNLHDAFSEANKARLVKQLGRMKTRRSLLASCSEEAGVFVPFCVVNSIPSVLFTLRSNQLNKHRGEVR